jgi:cohesin complex subunit SCC1
VAICSRSVSVILCSAIPAPSLDEWITASSQTIARRQDITLAEPLEQVREEDEFDDRGTCHRSVEMASKTVSDHLCVDAFGMGDTFGGGDWQAFDLEDALDKDGNDADNNRLNESVVSDIEVGREADTSGIVPANLDDSALMMGDEKSIAEDQAIEFGAPDMGFENAYEDQDMLPADTLDLENPDLDKSLNLSTTDLNLSLQNASRASIDFALVEGDEDAQAKTTRQRKKRKIGRDSVTELSSAVLKKGMNDVSDIVRTREITCKRTKTNGHISFDFTTAPDMFTRPCTVDLADDLLGMFKYTMKKRKFPFENGGRTEETQEEAAPAREEDEDAIEQARRMSDAEVCFATLFGAVVCRWLSTLVIPGTTGSEGKRAART